MKKILFAIIPALALLCSCEDRLNIVFEDYYVCIKDETESASSTVKSSVDNYVATYYISLVSPILDSPLTVNYEIVVGDGLKEHVDYELQSDKNYVTIARGIWKMPVRIKYMQNPVDETKDNTITIRLTGCSDKSINIGYPGPSAKFSSHVVTKIN